MVHRSLRGNRKIYLPRDFKAFNLTIYFNRNSYLLSFTTILIQWWGAISPGGILVQHLCAIGEGHNGINISSGDSILLWLAG